MPPGANLGFVYASDHFAGKLKDVTAVLRRITGIADWVGSVGIGVMGGNEEFYDRLALTVLAAVICGVTLRVSAASRKVTVTVLFDTT